MAVPGLRFAHWGLGVSVAVHVAAFVGLTELETRPTPRPLGSVVEFEVPPEPPQARPEPAPPPPKPLEAETPRAPVEPSPAEAAPATAAAEPKPPAPSEPAPQPVADLTGLTLTNEDGASSWGSRVGNGSALSGPIRTPRESRPAPRADLPKAPAPPRRVAPPVVPVSDLSERPVPPALDALLERHYPAVARQQGKGGTAVVRLRIDADGQVRQAKVVSESDAGFGGACRSTVVGSHWTPPRDSKGKSVATFVSYTCRFRVQ